MRNYMSYSDLPCNPKLKERARQLRKDGNLSEVILWKELHNKKFRGLDFDRQKIIGNFIVDFFCADCGVVLEIDGNSHHDKIDYDQEREAFLSGLGLTIIHIPVEDIFYRFKQVMKMLYAHPALQAPIK